MKPQTHPTSGSLMEKIKEYRSQTDEAIRAELKRYANSKFYGSLRYAVEGGKRLRPVILLLSCESVGKGYKDALPAAVAVELLHTESIIHDDVLDQEVSRRDRLAYHIRYGLGASILTADFVFGIILDIASRYEDPRIAKELSSAALRMCEGEFSELKIDPELYRLSWDEYINLISQKTASLFRISARIGGIIGGGDEGEIEALSSYGHHLGIAYQIQDDIFDWGKEEKVIRALKVEEGNPSPLSYLAREARFFAKEAERKLKPLKDGRAKRLLFELAEFVISLSTQKRDFI